MRSFFQPAFCIGEGAADFVRVLRGFGFFKGSLGLRHLPPRGLQCLETLAQRLQTGAARLVFGEVPHLSP